MNIIEVVPYKNNALQKIAYYNKTGDPWLYVYRKNEATADKMLKEADSMLNSGERFGYENPSFGWKNWCCVTFISYLATVACGKVWKMGSNANSYIWSPRYGYGYDQALLNLGFKKYNFSEMKLQSGDIVQSWTHAAIVETEDMTKGQTKILEGVRKNIILFKDCEKINSQYSGLILKVQEILKGWGYDITPNGKYDDKMVAIVKQWQKVNKVTATGDIAGIDWEWLEK